MLKNQIGLIENILRYIFQVQDIDYRKIEIKIIYNYDEIMNVLENDENVLGCYLSGAGPTLMAVIREEDKMGVVRLKEELGSLLNDWEVIKLELDHKGYTCDYE